MKKVKFNKPLMLQLKLPPTNEIIFIISKILNQYKDPGYDFITGKILQELPEGGIKYIT